MKKQGIRANETDNGETVSRRHSGHEHTARYLPLQVERAGSTLAPSGSVVTLITVRRSPSTRARERSNACLPGQAPRVRRLLLVRRRVESGITPRVDAASSSPTGPGPPHRALVEPLTNREEEVLQLLVLALSNAHMAERLQISVRTIETHLSNIYGKLGVRGRFEALRYALDAGE